MRLQGNVLIENQKENEFRKKNRTLTRSVRLAGLEKRSHTT